MVLELSLACDHRALRGVALVLLATLATLWIAARIFQNGYLHQGQAPSYRMLLSWLKRRD